LREIDRRMGFLQRRLRNVQVVDAREQRQDRVFFGAHVDVEDEDSGNSLCFQIVGVDEVDAGNGRISWQSPVGRSLLGKQLDESVAVVWDGGRRALTITAIRYDAPPAVDTAQVTALTEMVIEEEEDSDEEPVPPKRAKKVPRKK